ncbi:ribosome biogenesis protein tsr1 [Cichlidogyrus casuarinus]|uniref:Ribosome biogenesis protein tsr1 n=1 Tax=Cichlidogyrus casuarinus TaxID=1844966 RepID=A0ABD2QE28_9PLAT
MVNQERGLQMPIYVGVIPLDDSVDAKLLITLLTKTDKNVQKQIFNSNSNISHYYFQRYQSRVSFITANPKDLFSCIDLVNMVDFVLFVTPNDANVLESNEIDRLFTVLYSQGLPSTLFAVMSNLLDLKDLKRIIDSKFLVQEDKIRILNNIDDACVFMRFITTSKTPLNFNRDKLSIHAGPSATCQTAARLRSSIFAESIECLPCLENQDEVFIRVKGLNKGAPFVLSESLANETIELDSTGPYVYLPGWGDFKVDSVAWQKAKSIGNKNEDTKFFAWSRRKQFDVEEDEQQQMHEQEMIEADDQCLPCNLYLALLIIFL